VVVANDDGLGAGNVDGGEEHEHRLVVGHARLVDEKHGAVVEGELLVLEAPDKGGDGAAVDAGIVMKSAGGLAADGGTEDSVAVAFVAGAQHVEGAGLAGAGDADDEVEAPTGSEDMSDCVPLAVRQ
jgi:hypothetical protein